MMVDTVHYDDVAPWPTAPDGLGPTLELINPGLDNALAQSWEASCATHGTPGVQNCVFVSVSSIKAGEGAVTFRVIPNPFQTSARIIIDTEREIRDGTLTVYNLLGREVLRVDHISAKQVTVLRGSLPSGSYYFRFTDLGSNIVGNGKLIID
jgi:hypothetical protein